MDQISTWGPNVPNKAVIEMINRTTSAPGAAALLRAASLSRSARESLSQGHMSPVSKATSEAQNTASLSQSPQRGSPSRNELETEEVIHAFEDLSVLVLQDRLIQ